MNHLPRSTVIVVFSAAMVLWGCGSQLPDAPAAAPVVVAETGRGLFVPAELAAVLPESGAAAAIQMEATFENAGTAALQIVDIQSSCTCTTPAELARTILDPGQQVSIPIDVVPPPYGTKLATVRVITIPPSPDAILSIAAKGRTRQAPFVDEIPRVVNLVQTPGTPFRGVARLVCVERAGSDPWIRSARIVPFDEHDVDSDLDIDVTALPDPDRPASLRDIRRSYEIVVESTASQVSERFDVALEARDRASDGIVQLDQRISFSIKRVEMVRVVPQVIRWTRPVNDDSRIRQVLLAFAADDDWTVEVLPEAPRWLQVHVHQAVAPSIRQLRVSLELKDAPATPMEEELILSVHSPGRGRFECRIPIVVTDE